MIKLILSAALAMGIQSAHADGVKPHAAQAVSLVNVKGVMFFTKEPDGFRLVTTLVEGENGTPVRFTATLDDGQSVRISVPHPVGEPEEAVEFVRSGETLLFRDPLETPTSSID